MSETEDKIKTAKILGISVQALDLRIESSLLSINLNEPSNIIEVSDERNDEIVKRYLGELSPVTELKNG